MVGTGRKLERRLPYLLSSITPAWYYPYVQFEVYIDTHCSQTVALFCRPAAQEFLERWQCSCRQNTSVATTVLIERFLFQRLSWGLTCPSFILSNKLSSRTGEYRMDISKDQENIGHVKGHELWICHATGWLCCNLQLPVRCEFRVLKHEVQNSDLRFIHKVICRVVGHGTAVTYLGIKRRHPSATVSIWLDIVSARPLKSWLSSLYVLDSKFTNSG